MDCKVKQTDLKCNCTYDCKRHGKCCECIAHHVSHNNFPACFFSDEAEKTFDRSFEVLKKDREGGFKC